MPSIKDSLTGEGARPVIILDASGNQVTSFGGGGGGGGDASEAEQQAQTAILTTIDDDTSVLSGAIYTEGDTDASIAGIALMWEDTSDTLRSVSAAKPLPVGVISALPAGTSAIGKLAANSGVDIGDVDVTSVTPGTSATSLGKAVDGAAGATDSGVAMLAVRDDALTTLTPIDGDYVNPRVNARGATWTADEIAGTGTLTTQADQASSATLLSADSARKSWTIANDSDQALYLKAGATASTTDWTWLLPPYSSIFCDFYNGRVDGIWAANSTGNARITSFSA
mgnify:CR=1 FL=1